MLIILLSFTFCASVILHYKVHAGLQLLLKHGKVCEKKLKLGQSVFAQKLLVIKGNYLYYYSSLNNNKL